MKYIIIHYYHNIIEIMKLKNVVEREKENKFIITKRNIVEIDLFIFIFFFSRIVIMYV